MYVLNFISISNNSLIVYAVGKVLLIVKGTWVGSISSVAHLLIYDRSQQLRSMCISGSYKFQGTKLRGSSVEY